MSVNEEFNQLKQQIEHEKEEKENAKVVLKGRIEVLRLENFKLLEELEYCREIITNFNKNK